MVDYAKRSYLDGYVINDTDMDAMHIGVQGQGVVLRLGGELAVDCSGDDSTVTWSKGTVRVYKDGELYDVYMKSGSMNLASYQGSDYRKVMLFVDPYASLSDINPARVLAVAGTASAPYPSNQSGRYTIAPAPPDYQDSPLDTSCIPIAEVWLPPSGFDISSSFITDRRIFVPYRYGSTTEGGKCLFKNHDNYNDMYQWSRSGDAYNAAFEGSQMVLEAESSMYFPLSGSGWSTCEAMLPGINLLTHNLTIVFRTPDAQNIENVVVTLYGVDPDTGVNRYFAEYNNVINYEKNGGYTDYWHTTSIVKSSCVTASGTTNGYWANIKQIRVTAKALTGTNATLYIDNFKLVPIKAYEDWLVRGGVTFMMDDNAAIQALAATATSAEMNGVRGVVCVNPGTMNAGDIAAARTLQDLGWDIINHGVWHASLAHPTASTDYDKCYSEIVGGRICLENMGFTGAKHFSAPGANFNPTSCKITEKYCAFGRRGGHDASAGNNWPPDDIKLLRCKGIETPSMSTATMLGWMSAGNWGQEWTIFLCHSWSDNMTWAATKSIALNYNMMTFVDAWDRLSKERNSYSKNANEITDIPRGTDRETFVVVNNPNHTYTHGPVAGSGPLNTVTVSTNMTQSDFPRNAVLSCSNVATPAGSVVVYGKDVFGKDTTETISIAPGAVASGTTPMLYVEKYVIPAGVTSADSVGLGIGDWFGLSKPFWHWSDVTKMTKNGVDLTLSSGSSTVQSPFNAVRFTTCTAGETYSVFYKYAVTDYIPDKRRSGYAY